MTKRRGVALVVALVSVLGLAGPAMADGTTGDGRMVIKAADGNYYECLEYDPDQGCRTEHTSYDEQTGHVSDMWVAPSGRVYWLPGGGKGEYRYTPPPETEPAGPLVQPTPQPPAQEPVVYDPYGMNGDPSGCGGED